MGTLHAWWQRMTGGDSASGPVEPNPARPAGPKGLADLQLAGDPPARRPSRVGAAGFDPYSSDAGFSKPHTWERVDHD